MWDDGGSKTGAKGAAFDLSDFAAAALKFNEEMKSFSMPDAAAGNDKEDTMIRLLREQKKSNGDDDDDDGGLLQGEIDVEEEEVVPDWADDDDNVELLSEEKVAEIFKKANKNETKRNLLMEVCANCVFFYICGCDHLHAIAFDSIQDNSELTY